MRQVLSSDDIIFSEEGLFLQFHGNKDDYIRGGYRITLLHVDEKLSAIDPIILLVHISY